MVAALTVIGNAARGRWSLPLAMLLMLVAVTACSSSPAAGTAATATTPPAPTARATATTGAAAPSPVTASPPSSPPATPRPSPSGTARGTAARATAPAAYPPVVGLAVNALAADLRIPTEQIEVLRVEPKDWPDSGLGCPEPGRAYLDVITPGYVIFLGVGGRQFEYHSDRAKLVVRCDSARATPTVRTTPMTAYSDVVRLAIADLAGKLQLRPEEITVRQVDETEWPDSSLGCPEPGRAYLQVITPGYRVVLGARGQQYVYHTDRQNMVVPCSR